MDSNTLPKWTIDNSTHIVDDKFLKLRRDSCTTPQGGKVDKYYVLELADWVNCIAIDADDNVIMLHHYRHGVQQYLTEFIGGTMEPFDKTPMEAAKREVKEETGYTGGTFYHIGTGYPNPANHTNKVHSFLAVGGSIDHRQNLEPGETLTIQKIPFPDVIAMVSAQDAQYPYIYVAALFYAINFIRQSNEPSLQRLQKYL